MLRETEPYCQAPSAPCRRSLSNHSYLIVIINIDSVFSLEDKPYEGRDCTAKKLNRNLCSRLMCVYRYIYMNKRMRVRKGGKEGGRKGKRRGGGTGMIPTWSAPLYFLPISLQSSLHSKASPSSPWNFMEPASNLINYMSRGVMWAIFQLLLKRKQLSFSHTDKEGWGENTNTKDLPGQTRLATLSQDRSQWLSDFKQ